MRQLISNPYQEVITVSFNFIPFKEAFEFHVALKSEISGIRTDITDTKFGVVKI